MTRTVKPPTAAPGGDASTAWGHPIRRWRALWLPEEIDARPWADRCGYACDGVGGPPVPPRRAAGLPARPWPQRVEPTADRDALDAARAAVAELSELRARHGGQIPPDSRDAVRAHALRGLLRRVDGNTRTHPCREEWPAEHRAELAELLPRLPIELVAVALRRAPSDVRRIASEEGLECGDGAIRVREYATTTGLAVSFDGARATVVRTSEAGRTQLDATSSVVRAAYDSIGYPVAGLSLASIADALGLTREGARKRARRIGAETRPASSRDPERVVGPLDAWAMLLEETARGAETAATCACGQPATRALRSQSAACARCYERDKKRRQRMSPRG